MIHSYDCMLVGDEDEQLTEPELEMVFSECGDDAEGIMLLSNDVPEGYPEHLNLLKLVSDQAAGLDFGTGCLDFLIKESDLRFGNWKRTKAVLR